MVYLFSLIKTLQTNVRGGNQNVDENPKDDSEEENTNSDGSQKENTNSNDDWSSNIYVFKFGEGYYSFHELMNIWFYFVDVLIFFLLHNALPSFGQLWICACYLKWETFGIFMFPCN